MAPISVDLGELKILKTPRLRVEMLHSERVVAKVLMPCDSELERYLLSRLTDAFQTWHRWKLVV